MCYVVQLLTNTFSIETTASFIYYSPIYPLEPCHPSQQMNKHTVTVNVTFSVIELISKSVILLQDVAVKVLSIQDFSDDQLKEFLREVCLVYMFLSFLLLAVLI